jgi:hypothetical protein
VQSEQLEAPVEAEEASAHANKNVQDEPTEVKEDAKEERTVRILEKEAEIIQKE